VTFDTFVKKLLTEDGLRGSLADNHTPKSIANIHNVSVDDILYQLAMGIQVEYEHTKDKDVAKKIALDHLVEIPDYYDRLKKMEDEAEENSVEEMTSAEVVGTS
jgi:hypothetical protein